MIIRRWLVGRLRRFASLFICLTVISLLLLLANHLLKRTGLGRLLGHGWSGQRREMVQYYPHAGAGQVRKGVEKKERESKEKTETEVRGRRGEVLNKLLDPLETREVDDDVRVPESARLNVHMFYYAWYGNPATDNMWWHWNHKYLSNWQPRKTVATTPRPFHQPPDDIGAAFYPQLGPYSSRDPGTLAAHMEMMVKAGAGVVALSWYPPGLSDENGPQSDPVVPLLLNAANERGIKVCLHIEPFENRSVESVRNALLYANKRYGDHPAYLRVASEDRLLPVFYIYDSYRIEMYDMYNATIAARQWSRLFSRSGDLSVRGTQADALFIGLIVEENQKYDIVKAHMDGFYTYFASNGFTYGSTWKNWETLSRFGRKNGLLFIPSVGPGYDDTKIRPWNAAVSKDRHEGAYYETGWRAAVNARPSMVSVTSFNEWGEGTQIEPAVPYGRTNISYKDYSPLPPDYYLKATAKWAFELAASNP